MRREGHPLTRIVRTRAACGKPVQARLAESFDINNLCTVYTLDVIVHPLGKLHHIYFCALLDERIVDQAIDPSWMRNEIVRGMARKLSRAAGHRVVPPVVEDLSKRGWMPMKTARSRGSQAVYCEFSESREQDAESW